MAYFQILREVRLFEPGNWQLCFQFGTYEYDPDQKTAVPSEDGYRFIWRRPGGQLQGARGQARLMPEWITILLGMAAHEGWYPVPSAGIVRLGDAPAEGDLRDGAKSLRWAAQAQRRAFHQAVDAADPVLGIAEIGALADKLDHAAGLDAPARAAYLRQSVTASDLSIIAGWAKTALEPSFRPDQRETAMRTRFAALMRRLHLGLEPLTAPSVVGAA